MGKAMVWCSHILGNLHMMMVKHTVTDLSYIMIHNVGNPIINLPAAMIYTTHLWEVWGLVIIRFTTMKMAHL